MNYLAPSKRRSHHEHPLNKNNVNNLPRKGRLFKALPSGEGLGGAGYLFFWLRAYRAFNRFCFRLPILPRSCLFYPSFCSVTLYKYRYGSAMEFYIILYNRTR